MNKALAAGIGVVIVLIAISALYMMNQSGESTPQVELSENVEISAEETKGTSPEKTKNNDFPVYLYVYRKQNC